MELSRGNELPNFSLAGSMTGPSKWYRPHMMKPS